MLPKVDGYQVCVLLKRDTRYQKIPIVIFTARVQTKEAELASECGADTVVQKPFQTRELLETIRTLITRPAPSA